MKRSNRTRTRETAQATIKSSIDSRSSKSALSLENAGCVSNLEKGKRTDKQLQHGHKHRRKHGPQRQKQEPLRNALSKYYARTVREPYHASESIRGLAMKHLELKMASWQKGNLTWSKENEKNHESPGPGGLTTELLKWLDVDKR